jgi:hypothetical protein
MKSRQPDSLTMTVILAALLFAAVAWSFAPVVEAAPGAGAASMCDEIATAGNITIYQCVDLDGKPFLQNSYGFMTYQPGDGP